MSGTPPTFENYPGATSASDDWGDPGPAGPAHLMPGRAPVGPPPPVRSGGTRRQLLGVIGGSVAGLAVLAFLAGRGTEAGSASPTDSSWATAEPPEDSTNSDDVQGHPVSWTDDWTVDDLDDNQLVLVGGGATVIFQVFTADGESTAEQEARRLLARHAANLGKRGAVRTAKGGNGLIETGTATVSGTRDGRTMDAEVRVAIDHGETGEALAVIVVQRSGTSNERRDQISRMRRRFLDQVGG